MNELDFISSTLSGIGSYNELLEWAKLHNAVDPVYNEETNKYDPSVSLKFEDDSSCKLWLHDGKIIDSMHPCIISKSQLACYVYYYSSIMKKHNQPRVIFYKYTSGTTHFAKELVDICKISSSINSGRIHTTEADFLQFILVREPQSNIVVKFAD